MLEKADMMVIRDIAKRAVQLAEDSGTSIKSMDTEMDIACVHESMPLKLADLLAADNFNFSHDVFGIRSHLNRQTRELEDCFLPRFTA